MRCNCRKLNAVVLLSIFVYTISFIIKIILGVRIRSESLISDGCFSIYFILDSIIFYISIYANENVRDYRFLYKVKKVKGILYLIFGLIIFILGLELINLNIRTIQSEHIGLKFSIEKSSLIILLIIILIKFIINNYKHKLIKKQNYKLLNLNYEMGKKDIIVSFIVFFALLCVKIGLTYKLDSLISVVLIVIILSTTVELFKLSYSNCYLGVNKKTLEELVYDYNEVINVSKITIKASEETFLLEIYINIDAFISQKQVDELISNIKLEIMQEITTFVRVVIYLDRLCRF